jgi:hypothetical protein|tara:strand:+ start:373 stop:675 length:303 start_codon:yes stop_codon:yes gene_type:complete
MKRNSMRYLEGLVKRGVRMNLRSLKQFRNRERGIDSIVKKIVPTTHKDLMDVTNTARWLMTNAPEEYIYGEMVDIDNAIASNLSYYLRRYANSYIGQLSQ